MYGAHIFAYSVTIVDSVLNVFNVCHVNFSIKLHIIMEFEYY